MGISCTLAICDGFLAHSPIDLIISTMSTFFLFCYQCFGHHGLILPAQPYVVAKMKMDMTVSSWMNGTVLKCPFLLQLKQTDFLAGQTFSPWTLPQLEHLLPKVGVPTYLSHCLKMSLLVTTETDRFPSGANIFHRELCCSWNTYFPK